MKISQSDAIKKHEADRKLREADKGKFASDKASADSVSQGIKRRLEATIGK